MRVFLSLFAAVYLFAAATPEDSHPLQHVNRPPIPGEKKCSDLFYTNDFGGATEKQIVFAYTDTDGTVKRDTIPFSRIAVQISDTGPTYEKSTTGDGYTGALFRLTDQAYQESRTCMPQPQPQEKK